jgi:hypothetical protein
MHTTIETPAGMVLRFVTGVTTGLPLGEFEVIEAGPVAEELGLEGEELYIMARAEYQAWSYNKRQRQAERLRKAGLKKDRKTGTYYRAGGAS